MLPNHAPLVVAEQFGTLESLFPGAIDLGLGRAPGTDPRTAHALRRTLASNPDAFPHDLIELMSFFQPAGRADRPRGARGRIEVPIYILGSSLFGAQVAAALGLPFAFASHFAAAQMMQAVELYRRDSIGRRADRTPYVILGVNIVAADTDDEARLLATSGRQAFASLRPGTPTSCRRQAGNRRSRSCPSIGRLEEVQSISFVGSAGTCARRSGRSSRTQPDELIVVSHIFDHAARLRSYEITVDVARGMNRLEESRT